MQQITVAALILLPGMCPNKAEKNLGMRESFSWIILVDLGSFSYGNPELLDGCLSIKNIVGGGYAVFFFFQHLKY